MSAPAPVAYHPVLLRYAGRPAPVGLDEYGGYGAWRKAQELTPEQVTEEVKQSNLKGRGGAAFPTGAKWGFVPKVDGPKYLAVNADESEPGTFKDREIIETNPHLLVEGILIACYAFGAKTAFVYIRGEYHIPADRLEAAIAEARQAGLLGDYEIFVFRGAGAYICGEETALLESLEGRRPMPRSRPPFPAVEGLYGRPTVINNVETLANVPGIISNGAEWFKGIDPKIFCLSGHVNRPGNYELPLGSVTVRELIEEHGQGVIGRRAVKGVLPAGASAPMLTADQLDTKLDYDSIKAAGSMLGSASLIVLDDRVCMVRAAARMVEFFRKESCGKCTPCREGTQWLHKILVRLEEGVGTEGDLDLLLSVADEIAGKVLCALGDFSVSPVVATVHQFRDEYLEHLRLGKCPFGSWAA
ncbi:MAG: NADH-quinone oxidoreductase subunit NuoF [Chloroflexi bacterium]|nr:NADH-quinone oxidoreductase subunit NuoF [Chloroflexota bacterium]